jgi:tetratricopeptide (TPR) repeat protein
VQEAPPGDFEREIERLAAAFDFRDAVELCERRGASHPEERPNLRLLMGLLCFLNEESMTEQARAIDHLRAAVALDPDNPEAWFWLGYATWIMLAEREAAVEALRRCLERDPRHAYAHLALASLSASDDEALARLGRVLEAQPANYRALLESEQRSLAAGRHEAARRAAATLAEQEPYVETGLGIMNRYVNEALTWSAEKDGVRRQARRLLREEP